MITTEIRMMFKITDDNYNDFKKVSEIFWMVIAKFYGYDPNGEFSPIVVLNEWEMKSKSLAKRGLKAGLIDEITMAMDLPIALKKEINDQLISKGHPEFNLLVSTVKDTLQKALKRGKVKNLDEYYILKELLDNSRSNISETDKMEVERILGNYEINYGKRIVS